MRGVRGGAPLSLLIHGLARLAILVGWPCSAYDAHNNRGDEAAIRAASCNFLSISNMPALTQRDRGSVWMLCALTDLIN